MEPEQTGSMQPEVLIAAENTLFVVDAYKAENKLLKNGPFTAIAVSPNGKFLALFTKAGLLWVVSSDFLKVR